MPMMPATTSGTFAELSTKWVLLTSGGDQAL